jgi:hypothetical protein
MHTSERDLWFLAGGARSAPSVHGFARLQFASIAARQRSANWAYLRIDHVGHKTTEALATSRTGVN